MMTKDVKTDNQSHDDLEPTNETAHNNRAGTSGPGNASLPPPTGCIGELVGCGQTAGGLPVHCGLSLQKKGME